VEAGSSRLFSSLYLALIVAPAAGFRLPFQVTVSSVAAILPLLRKKAAMPKLIVKSGSQAGRQIELPPGAHRVGRNPDNSIHIPEPSISSFHCEIHAAAIATSVHDLGSTNGTFINRKPVIKGMLQNGDTLTLGDIDFTVELQEVNVALPEMRFEEALGAAFLEDGTPACFTHREVPATFTCTKCETWWCNDCVRLLKRITGDTLKFCPECDAPCAELPREDGAARRRKTFLSRLGDTLRLARKK
jgi:hypothetical protein